MTAQMKPASLRSTRDRPQVSGQLGGFETRLAQSPEEIDAAQRVRFEVFRKSEPVLNQPAQRDHDRFDLSFDHLLLIDPDYTENIGIVGTQRFQVRRGSDGVDGFYSASEFDLEPMLANHKEKNFMELGRSCILPQYRDKRTMELLWHGTWDYAVKNHVDVMFGCASFPTTSPETIEAALSFLHQTSPAQGDWSVEANGPAIWNIPPANMENISTKKLLKLLPPLIKGYMRLGAMFSHQAVIDYEFGTTDILVILPVTSINPRYVAHYGADASRHSVQ